MSLPLIYLEIHISNTHLGIQALKGVPSKLRKRLSLGMEGT
jgi:hypothetical protein